MNKTDFKIYSIPGSFLTAIKKAQFLREKGFDLIIHDGKICFKNVNEYMKAYLALTKSGILTDNEQDIWKDILRKNLNLDKSKEKKSERKVINKDVIKDEKDFISFNIPGYFLDACKIAMFLRKNGFDVNLSNGNVCIKDVNSYMKAYKLLKQNHMIRKKDDLSWKNEIYTKLKYKYALNKNYKCCKQGNNRVLMNNKQGDFLSIIKQKNKETGRVEYSILAKNNDSICNSIEGKMKNRISSYYISNESPLYEVAKYYSELGNVSKSIKFIPSVDGYILNVIDYKPMRYYRGVCSLKFNSNEILENLYNAIDDSKKQEKESNKKYVKIA